MKVLDVLTDESRWVKACFGSIGAPRCLGGALSEADISGAGWRRVTEAIGVLFPERTRPDRDSLAIVDFNNHPDTTFEDVRRVVKFADV